MRTGAFPFGNQPLAFGLNSVIFFVGQPCLCGEIFLRVMKRRPKSKNYFKGITQPSPTKAGHPTPELDQQAEIIYQLQRLVSSQKRILGGGYFGSIVQMPNRHSHKVWMPSSKSGLAPLAMPVIAPWRNLFIHVRPQCIKARTGSGMETPLMALQSLFDHKNNITQYLQLGT